MASFSHIDNDLFNRQNLFVCVACDLDCLASPPVRIVLHLWRLQLRLAVTHACLRVFFSQPPVGLFLNSALQLGATIIAESEVASLWT